MYIYIYIFAVDVDACLTEPCENRAQCTDLPEPDQFACACLPGFEGDTCSTGKCEFNDNIAKTQKHRSSKYEYLQMIQVTMFHNIGNDSVRGRVQFYHKQTNAVMYIHKSIALYLSLYVYFVRQFLYSCIALRCIQDQISKIFYTI